MAPPRVVDWQPETDELALLQTIEGGAGDEEGEEAAQAGSDDDAVGAMAARRRQARWGQGAAGGAFMLSPMAVAPCAAWVPTAAMLRPAGV